MYAKLQSHLHKASKEPCTMKNCLQRKRCAGSKLFFPKFTNRSSIDVGTEKADSFKLIALNQREPGLCVMASFGRHYVRMKHNCYQIKEWSTKISDAHSRTRKATNSNSTRNLAQLPLYSPLCGAWHSNLRDQLETPWLARAECRKGLQRITTSQDVAILVLAC